MLERLRTAFAPRLEFEQRAYRARLTTRVLVGYFTLLAAWLLVSVPLHLVAQGPGSYGTNLDLLVVGVLAPSGLVSILLLRRGWVLAVGYVLAASVYLIGTASMILVPEGVYLYSPLLVLATLIAGAAIGGEAAFLFASLSLLTGAFGWWYAGRLPGFTLAFLDAAGGVLFLITLAIAAFSTASILHSFSRQVQRTILRLHEQAERLATLANTDPLTGIANRRYLLDQLDREVERARRYRRPLSLVYIDLDGFKAVNDRHGHLFGDEVLKGAATAMRAVLRSTDLMARIGGDEFAVLMPETTLAGAENATDKLRRALTAFSGRMKPAISELNFCAGVSQMRDDDNGEAILSRADDAQYLAKGNGKGHTRTEEELAQRSRKP
jgi:diguanylate cyclase (GGDEF)-like protein